MIKKIIHFTSFCLLIFTALSCGEKPSNPTGLASNDFPAPPNSIKISIADRMIGLSWSHGNIESVANFKVYRQDSTSREFRFIGASDSTFYRDINLVNNRIYRYRISSVGVNGLEGAPSEPVVASPAVFSVLINSGQTYTNTRVVSLAFTAPPATAFVLISNNPLFDNAQWEAFTSPKNWALSEGDGEKTVYVKFRDSSDRETVDPYTDRIILDTEAVIKQVFHDAQGRILTPADTVHFAVVTDEIGGRASVDINTVRLGLELFDNGTNGDRIANDGIYEVDYVVPTGPEVESTLVVGHFVDIAGNVANALNAPSRLTIRRPPTAVELIEVAPTINSSRKLNLFWSRNSDADFANYRIFRSLIPGVNNGSPLVTIIQNQAATTFTDTTLVPNTRYYYRVYVYDVTGLFFGSNERSGTTNPN